MSGRTRTVPFDSKEYWEDRFDHEEEFEWILNWDRIQPHLAPYLPTHHPILHLGCGNSPLAFDMADAGYQRIVNVDYSARVIENQKRRSTAYDQLEWITADCVQDLSGLNRTYRVVIEKTLTDCVACGDDDALSRQHSMARQIASVQPVGGLWLCISFSSQRTPLPPYFLKERIQLLVPQVNDKTRFSVYDQSVVLLLYRGNQETEPLNGEDNPSISSIKKPYNTKVYSSGIEFPLAITFAVNRKFLLVFKSLLAVGHVSSFLNESGCKNKNKTID